MIKAIKNMTLIGLNVEIIDSKNNTLIGFKGEIIDETRNTIKIQEGDQIKTMFKDQITIKTKYNNKNIIIKGNLLKGRSENKTK